MMLLLASANRDHRASARRRRLDIRRQIITTSPSATASTSASVPPGPVEARIALDEILTRFPSGSVDWDNAELDSSQVRGWSTLPVHLPN